MTKISNLYSLTNYITANTSGNIVISAPSSGYALDVTGTGRFTGAVTAANFYVPSSNEIRLYNTNSTNWGTIKGSTDSTNGYITLTGGSGNGMTIANSGNVGINISSPTSALHINSSTGGNQKLTHWGEPGYADTYGLILRGNSADGVFKFFGLNAGTEMTTATLTMNRNGGNVGMPATYGFTTSNAANLYIDSGAGLLYRSTSSLKYKTNVKDYDKRLDIVSQIRPVYYEGIGASDSGKVFAGLIAEEIHDLGLTEFVQYAEDGTPDALAYQNMVSLLIKGIQELSAKVTALENK